MDKKYFKNKGNVRTWIRNYANSLQNLPPTPPNTSDGEVEGEWLAIEDKLYEKAQDKFEGVKGFGTAKEWGAETSDWTWVYWFCVDMVEELILKNRRK